MQKWKLSSWVLGYGTGCLHCSEVPCKCSEWLRLGAEKPLLRHLILVLPKSQLILTSLCHFNVTERREQEKSKKIKKSNSYVELKSTESHLQNKYLIFSLYKLQKTFPLSNKMMVSNVWYVLGIIKFCKKLLLFFLFKTIDTYFLLISYFLFISYSLEISYHNRQNGK